MCVILWQGQLEGQGEADGGGHSQGGEEEEEEVLEIPTKIIINFTLCFPSNWSYRDHPRSPVHFLWC